MSMMRPPAADRCATGAFVAWIALGFILAIAAASPVLQPPASTAAVVEMPPVPILIALQWTPQSQFAGYYMAREQGIYRALGLEVQLVHVDAERNSLDMLRAGQVTLASANLSDALMAAVPGSDVTAPEVAQVAQLVQRSNLLLVAWKDMGITQPSDLHGLRVSHWQGALSTVFEAFFAAHGISVNHVPQYASVSLFLRRGTAACAAMEYNEYHRIWQAGVDTGRLTTFVLRDMGFGFAEDGLYGWLVRAGGLDRPPSGYGAGRARSDAAGLALCPGAPGGDDQGRSV